MESNGLLPQQFRETSVLLAQGRWKEVSLQFDSARPKFEMEWARTYEEFANRPSEAIDAAKNLILSQPDILGLTFAMARCDTVELFAGYKRLLEFMLKRTERTPGYPAIAGVPHLQAGFLYMAASTMAFHWESWRLFEKLLSTKFEWYYHSGRPIFSYPFDLPYFFHSDALNRDAAKAHDFYRMEMVQPAVLSVTGLDRESSLDTYLQTQMMMCLKVAQMREQSDGEMVNIWPDFGRFYGERVSRLIDRAYADREYAEGLVRAFNETPDTFFARLNQRLSFIQSALWQGSPYFYESIGSWEPNQTRA